MSSVVISGDTSGAITLAAPAVSGTNTATLPAATGTVMVSGNQPAFLAYAGAGTALSNGAFTKVLFNTETFDTNNNFASSTFTPTVAGYYQFSAGVSQNGTYTSTNNVIGIHKNGTWTICGSTACGVAVNGYWTVSGLLYMNGSTDYVEVYIYQSSGGTINTNSGVQTSFSGCLVRNA